jgi:hypothetical protein
MKIVNFTLSEQPIVIVSNVIMYHIMCKNNHYVHNIMHCKKKYNKKFFWVGQFYEMYWGLGLLPNF